MKQLLEAESKAEKERDSKIAAAENDEQKATLVKENEQAKALASDKINKLKHTHDSELRRLEGH